MVVMQDRRLHKDRVGLGRDTRFAGEDVLRRTIARQQGEELVHVPGVARGGHLLLPLARFVVTELRQRTTVLRHLLETVLLVPDLRARVEVEHVAGVVPVGVVRVHPIVRRTSRRRSETDVAPCGREAG